MIQRYYFYLSILLLLLNPADPSLAQTTLQQSQKFQPGIDLSGQWKTSLLRDGKSTSWQTVDIPHNWDDYYGARQLTHGNLHGSAVYEKNFDAPAVKGKDHYFLVFEGVGTYASITLNGHFFGKYPVGRTTLSLDVTNAIKAGQSNHLLVQTDHPEMIMDMPWVCGGCSSEWGFSEGSQPFGIFRPVRLEIKADVRIEPFGVHVWHDDRLMNINIETELKNYGHKAQSITVINTFKDKQGKIVFELQKEVQVKNGESKLISQSSPIKDPILWDLSNPYLYSLTTVVRQQQQVIDKMQTAFGIRSISWPVKRNDGDSRFYLNGKPVFINGTCEYEHEFGQSHAFSKDQIAARVKEVEMAGFNAFRDAHQPHHLLYQSFWDKDGILFWPQFSAHIWYDTKEFRDNFKALLRQWVKERRNSPSVILWGLQNESVLPKEFAEECTDIIREMDPTARNMRAITTCNGGQGTDWNVVQNWSGTYGGNLYNYASELAQPNQLLNGEYGAWRSIDLHTEPGPFEPNGTWSEERMCQLMEAKIRLAEQARDSVCGQFQWVFTSHDNPGRQQPDEAYRIIDKVGPFNYKGLLTPWEEPLDVFYMYQSNYTSAARSPMVYISSHTWLHRFANGEAKKTIQVYSNCDSVLLYNSATIQHALGSRASRGVGTHFTWENVFIKYNVLHAVAYYAGKAVAEDWVILDHLQRPGDFSFLYKDASNILKAEKDYNYIVRVNCGGDEYKDEFGQVWMKDDTTISYSWAQNFHPLNPYQASQRFSHDPVAGTKDWSLFQHGRFGRHKLYYRFNLPNGKYRVELYFNEPWYGTGAGAQVDYSGLRIFDVAINGKLKVNDLDIWKEAGHDHALKKVVDAEVANGELIISFPEVKASQAIISAIAIASKDKSIQPINISSTTWNWLKADTDTLAVTPKALLPEDQNIRPVTSYKAENANIHGAYVVKDINKKAGVLFESNTPAAIEWEISTGLAQEYAIRIRYANLNASAKTINLKLVAANGTVLKDDDLTLTESRGKWATLSTTTGGFINAGAYKIVLSATDMQNIGFDMIDIQ